MHSAQKSTDSVPAGAKEKLAFFQAEDAKERRFLGIMYGVVIPLAWAVMLILARTAEAWWQQAIVLFDAGLLCAVMYQRAMQGCDSEEALTRTMEKMDELGHHAFEAGVRVGVMTCGHEVVAFKPTTQDGIEGVELEVRDRRTASGGGGFGSAKPIVS